jgi:WD40 repeat protein
LNFSSDEKLLGAASEQYGAEISVWDVESGRQLFKGEEGYDSPAMAFDFFPGSNWIVWGHEKLQISDPVTHSYLATLTNETYQATAVAVSPDGSSIAVGRRDGTVLLVNTPVLDRLSIRRPGPALQFLARASVNYAVEQSFDLRTWTLITNVVGDGTRVEKAVVPSQNTFYRVRY